MASVREQISEEEAALYDRQIRLWGLEAQSRLKKSKLLVVGLSPLAGEIVKNIILSGINTLVLCDSKTVGDNDVEHCFLFGKSHVGKMRNESALPRAQELNERVKIISECNTGPSFLAERYGTFDEIVISQDFKEKPFKQWIEYIEMFGTSKRPSFHCVATFGMHAVGFADLGHYDFERDEHGTKSDKTNGYKKLGIVEYPALRSFFDPKSCRDYRLISRKRMAKGFYLSHLLYNLRAPLTVGNLKELWPIVAESLNVPSTVLSDDDFESCCGPTLVAINAIMGGIISQEIIQALSHKATPKGNWYFLDGRTCEVTVLWLPHNCAPAL